jgi:hypothetical protein
MKTKKNAAAVFIAAIMLITVLVSCKEEESVNVKTSDVNYLFSQSEIAVPGNYGNVPGIVYKDGNFFFLTSTTEEKDGDYKASHTLTETDEGGNIIKSKVISSYSIGGSDETTTYMSLSVSADGKLLAAKSTIKMNNDSDGNSRPVFETVITSFDDELNETVFFDIPKAIENAPEVSGKEEFSNISAAEFIVDEAGFLFVKTSQSVLVFDTNSGKYLFSAETDKLLENAYLEHLFLIDGAAGVSIKSYRITDEEVVVEDKISLIDPAKKGFGESFDTAAAATTGTLLPGNADYPVIILSSSELYSFDITTGEKTLLIDFLASGMNVTAEKIMVIGEGKFAAFVSEYQEITYRYSAKVLVFNKLDPATVKPREVAEVFMIYRDPEFMEFAADFNKTSTDYQINVKSFYEGTDGNFDGAVSQLNNELLAGNIPDILIIDKEMPYDIYASKGLLYDLNKYLKKDKEIDYGDLNKTVIKVLETDGKLYSVTREFELSGLMAKTSVIGDERTLTVKKLQELTEQYPEADIFGRINRMGFVQGYIGSRIRAYAHKETGYVNFNCPEFIELIKFAKNLPEEWPDDNGNEMEYASDHSIFAMISLSDFRSYVFWSSHLFGEPTTFTGFITPEGSGIDMNPAAEIAMMTNGNREAAYAVIKAYLKKEPTDNAKLSVWDSVNRAAAEKAKLPETAIDPVTGEEVEADNHYSFGGVMRTLPNNTDADNEAVFDAIDNIGGVTRRDSALLRIVEEEVSAYFAGAKTAEECAALIENRAEIYMAEIG